MADKVIALERAKYKSITEPTDNLKFQHPKGTECFIEVEIVEVTMPDFPDDEPMKEYHATIEFNTDTENHKDTIPYPSLADFYADFEKI